MIRRPVAPVATATKPAACIALALLAACAAPATPPAVGTARTAADCSPLLRALQVARAAPQVAQYRVDAAALPLQHQPSAFRIGDLLHETEDGRLLARRLAPGEDPLAETLQAALARGGAWCRVGPEEHYQGRQVSRIEFHHPQLAERYQPTTLLVDRASGRPLWHGYAGLEGGYAWVYGGEPPR